jgi:hypothetical protein
MVFIGFPNIIRNVAL